MRNFITRIAFAALALLTAIAGGAGLARADEPAPAAEHAHPAAPDRIAESFVPTNYPRPFGLSLAEAWLDPWPHSHFSRRGTPFVHLFTVEPAFLDRDLFFDYRVARGDEEDEAELEVELEWALTRRIGLVVEAPIVQVNSEEGDTETGLGDVAIAPRVMLVDTDRFLLSANLEMSFPSGSESRGLGTGEAGLAPSLSMWLDFGHWVTASAQVGTEHGLESGDAELFYNGALTYSFLTPGLYRDRTHAELDHNHFPPGLANLIVELTGRTGLSGENDGRTTAEVLFGASYNFTESWEVRGGYQIPVGGQRDIDDGFVFSVIYHF
jgi:hypothetical protein